MNILLPIPLPIRELIQNIKQGSKSGKTLDPFNSQVVSNRDNFVLQKGVNDFSKTGIVEKIDDLKIINVIDSLPWQPKKKWSKRNVNQIKNIIIHQSASKGAGIDAINSYHISSPNHISSTGCPHICYHFFIDPLGKVYQANDVTDITWHCKNYNVSSIGICLQGDFLGPSYKGTQNRPSTQQIDSLKKICLYLIKIYPFLNKDIIWGHEHFDPVNKQNCPGLYTTTWIKNLKENNV